MSKIQIKTWDGSVLFETDAESLGAAVVAAVAAKANLYGANLYGANLSRADLSGANLYGAKIIHLRTILLLPDGDLIGWKKLQNEVICKLKIPAKAKRVGGLIGRKCRAEFAIVIKGAGKSIRDGMPYKVGKKVKPDKFDPDPTVECSNGIHFYITEQEAKDHQ